MSEKVNKNGGNFLPVLVIAALTLFFLAGVLFFGQKGSSPDNKEGASSSANLLGQKAPDFELEDFDGRKVSLASVRGKKVILFFSEGLMCYPACWDQMAKLGSDPRLNSDSVTSFSVIVDQKNDWQKTYEKMPELRQARVLFDIFGTASRSFQTLNLESSMHRGRYPGHTYFILDREGVVRFFYDDPRMGIRNDLLWSELSKIP